MKTMIEVAALLRILKLRKAGSTRDQILADDYLGEVSKKFIETCIALIDEMGLLP